MEKQAALDLLEFIHESPTNFHAVLSIKQRLQAHGFKQLFSGEAWHIEHGGKYFVTKNHSSLYAFIPGNGNLAEEGFKLICAHSDSPTFRIKPHAEMPVEGKYLKLNTEVYGFSYHTAEITEAKADNISLPASRRTRILMLHGGDAKHVPFDRNALAASPFSYIALGHIHKPEVLLENRMAYAGSPEPLDMTETGPHGYFVGEIDNASGHVTSLQFKEVCQAQYIPLVVNVTPQTTNTELSQIIADEIRKRGAGNIYRFRIRGMRDPDISFDLDLLSGQWNIIEILDESEPQYDFHALFAEHPSDMIGFYIQALMKEDMSPVEKKALYYGIHALLMTKDERSQP